MFSTFLIPSVLGIILAFLLQLNFIELEDAEKLCD